MLTNFVRQKVSRKKKRYRENGFDLDLVYVGEKIIAMGFPAENIESTYRNNIDDVVRFLDSKHEGKYKVYNLCSERSYHPKKFHNRVAIFPFDDHNPPSFELIDEFCCDVDKWLKRDEHNVVAVHCKAGKGRTGVMICCYLLHSGQYTEAQKCLEFYGEARTRNGKGVTISSQKLYVEYYEKIVRGNLSYTPKTLYLNEVLLEVSPPEKLPSLSISIIQAEKTCDVVMSGMSDSNGAITFNVTNSIALRGDIKIKFFFKGVVGKTALFHFWFNTFFVEYTTTDDDSDDHDSKSKSTRKNDMIKMTMHRNEIDKVNTSTLDGMLSRDFEVTLCLSRTKLSEEISGNSNMGYDSESEWTEPL